MVRRALGSLVLVLKAMSPVVRPDTRGKAVPKQRSSRGSQAAKSEQTYKTIPLFNMALLDIHTRTKHGSKAGRLIDSSHPSRDMYPTTPSSLFRTFSNPFAKLLLSAPGALRTHTSCSHVSPLLVTSVSVAQLLCLLQMVSCTFAHAPRPQNH